MLKTYQQRRSSGIHEHARAFRVPTAGSHPIEIKSSPAHCMTLGPWQPTDRSIWWSLTHNTAAQGVTNTSTPTSATWRTLAVTIPAEWSIWQPGLLSKMVCPTDRHHGICGETIGFLFPGLQYQRDLKLLGVTTDGSPHHGPPRKQLAGRKNYKPRSVTCLSIGICL